MKTIRCCVLCCRLSEGVGNTTAKLHLNYITLCDGAGRASCYCYCECVGVTDMYLLGCRLTHSQCNWRSYRLERHITSSHRLPLLPLVITLLLVSRVITSFHLPLSPPVISSLFYLPSSPSVITSRHHLSLPPIIISFHHLPSSPSVITSR